MQARDIDRRRRAFGDRLRWLRRERGMTQEQLALSASIDRSFYVEVENARHSITLDKIFAISDALNVPMEDLFRGV